MVFNELEISPNSPDAGGASRTPSSFDLGHLSYNQAAFEDETTAVSHVHVTAAMASSPQAFPPPAQSWVQLSRG